jgi:phage terminase large subunit
MREISVTNVFDRLFRSTSNVIVCRGGARSSKSYSIAQYITHRLVDTEEQSAILITRKTMPSLKITAYKLIVDLLKDYGYYNHCYHNKTDNIIIYGPTNSFIYFVSIDDSEKIKSTEWNVIWAEEATEFKYDDYLVLKTRLSAPTKKINQLILSFNPISSLHWIKQRVVDVEKEVDEIVSNYKDNPFLSQDYIDILLSLNEQDKNYARVYVDGEWGSLDHIIYANWGIVNNIPTFDRTIYGCDFGYNAQTAITECGLITNTNDVYLTEKLYRSEMTNKDLIGWIKNNLPSGSIIFCDSAEPNRIAEMKQAGINARQSDKSVKDGIDFCRRKKLLIDSNSINLIKEIQSYTYKTDRAGQVLDEPVKFNDHLCDSFRYALYTHSKGPKFTSLITGD